MEEFLDTLLWLNIGISILAFVMLAFQKITERRYSAKMRYYAWLILIIGLLIPVRPNLNNFFKKIPHLENVFFLQKQEDKRELKDTAINELEYTVADELKEYSIESIEEKTEKNQDLFNSIYFNERIKQGIFIVWFLGMMFSLIRIILRHLLFLKHVQRWSYPVEDPVILSVMSKIIKTRKKEIPILMCGGIDTPMLFGMVHPKILLPELEPAVYNEMSYEFILRHELLHERRKDIWYQLLVSIAGAIHWFNPILLLAFHRIALLCEQSCDEAVLQNADIERRYCYVETILQIIQNGTHKTTILSTSFYGGKKDMKRRIDTIMDGKKKKTGTFLLGLALVGVIGGGAVFAKGKEPLPSQENMSAEETRTKDNSKSVSSVDINLKDTSLKSINPENISTNNISSENITSEDILRIQLEVMSLEEMCEKEYAVFGLEYKKETNQLYYQGKKVRQFDDIYPVGEEGFVGISYTKKDGVIDVKAIRDLSKKKRREDGSYDPAGKLTGLRIATKEEFDITTKQLEESAHLGAENIDISSAYDSDLKGSEQETKSEINSMNSAVNAVQESATGGAPYDKEYYIELYKEYEPFGLIYHPEDGRFYYKEQLVRYFIDVLSGNDMPIQNKEFQGSLRLLSNTDGEVDIYTKRDKNGTLLSVETATKEEFEERTKRIKQEKVSWEERGISSMN